MHEFHFCCGNCHNVLFIKVRSRFGTKEVSCRECGERFSITFDFVIKRYDKVKRKGNWKEEGF